MTTREAAVYARRHPVTVRKAMEGGDLHGRQPSKGGHWVTEEACVDAWLSGESCPHAELATVHRKPA